MSSNLSGVPTLVLIHPRLNKIATQEIDLLARFEKYAEVFSLATKDPNIKFLVIGGIDGSRKLKFPKETHSRVEIVLFKSAKWTFPFFMFNAVKYLRCSKVSPRIFLAGDLTLGLFATWCVRFFWFRGVPIQISVHGSIRSYGAKMRGLFKSIVFNSISLPLIRKVESVRVVSRHLAREVEEFAGLPNSRIVIAPIPMAWFPENRLIRTDGFHIAVIGRFHQERNISEILSILSAVLPNQDLRKVTFAGSGELIGVIESWSQNSPQSAKIEIITGLNATKVVKLLSGTDALLSAAMTEGYGLSIREALVSGVTVVARKNKGTEEVLEDFNSGIYLYDKINLAVEIINKLIRHEFSGPSVNAPAIQKAIDTHSMRSLASSWSQLSNSV